MRTLFVIVVAVLVGGCASTPANLAKVYDHKYNTTAYASKEAQSDFVGTSAPKADASKPAWYWRLHP